MSARTKRILTMGLWLFAALHIAANVESWILRHRAASLSEVVFERTVEEEETP